MPPHVVLDASNAFHLSTNQRVKYILNGGHSYLFVESLVSRNFMHTMTVTCDANALGSMMKRMTLTKPRAALTISLVRDDSSKQMLCSSCSKVLMSMASGKDKDQNKSVGSEVFDSEKKNKITEVSRPTFILKH